MNQMGRGEWNTFLLPINQGSNMLIFIARHHSTWNRIRIIGTVAMIGIIICVLNACAGSANRSAASKCVGYASSQVVACGVTVASEFVVSTTNGATSGCVSVRVVDTDHEGSTLCLSSSTDSFRQPTVNCRKGLLTIRAQTLPTARSVRLTLSDGHTIISPTIVVPGHRNGSVGLYYQVVRGPEPTPMSLTELDGKREN